MTRLDRPTVVETALRLLNETGLDGLTLRRIATELDVKAPALYWHFDNKQALLDEMATEMFRGMARTVEGPASAVSWVEWLRESMRVLRSTLLGYRDGAKVFSGSRFTDTGYAQPLEAVLGKLVAQGFTPEAAARAWFTAYSYTIGFVIEEQAVHPVPGERDPHYDIEARAERIGADFPVAAAVGRELFDNYEAGFESGLTAVIAGIGATLGPEGRSAAPA